MWSPIRTLTGRGVGHGSARKTRWIDSAAATASGAEAKTAKRLSPSPLGRIGVPPCLPTAASNSASCRASADRIASGAASQSAVLPSTSVSRNVTVPVGSAAASMWIRVPSTRLKVNDRQTTGAMTSTSIPSRRPAHSSQATGVLGSGVYEQYRPVRIVAVRCRPSDGCSRARFVIAARIARVALRRARSAWDAALRPRPPRPTARASSRTRNSRSSRARSARTGSLNSSASSISSCSSSRRALYAVLASASSRSPASPKSARASTSSYAARVFSAGGARLRRPADQRLQVRRVQLPPRLRQQQRDLPQPLGVLQPDHHAVIRDRPVLALALKTVSGGPEPSPTAAARTSAAMSPKDDIRGAAPRRHPVRGGGEWASCMGGLPPWERAGVRSVPPLRAGGGG